MLVRSVPGYISYAIIIVPVYCTIIDIICKYVCSDSASLSCRFLAYQSKVLSPFPFGQVGSSSKFLTYLWTTIFLMTVQVFCMVRQDSVWGKNARLQIQHLKLPENKLKYFRVLSEWMTFIPYCLPKLKGQYDFIWHIWRRWGQCHMETLWKAHVCLWHSGIRILKDKFMYGKIIV